ncbi:efflux RND transporter periplasmic adaptor subunit [Bacteroidota bacterium]
MKKVLLYSTLLAYLLLMSCHNQEGEAANTHEAETEHTHEAEAEQDKDADAEHAHEGETADTHEAEVVQDNKDEAAHTHEGEALPDQAAEGEIVAEEDPVFDMSLISLKKIEKQKFNGIIKTTGEILPDQSDEIIITAPANGIISFLNQNLMAGMTVANGRKLFHLKGGGGIENNIEVKYIQSQYELEKYSSDYERAKKLIVDKIISEKDFQKIKMDYEKQLAEYNNLEKNFHKSGVVISTPTSGYIKDVFVIEGDYVEQGQKIASLIKNRSILIRADVPQKYFSDLDEIISANFITVYDQKLYDLEEINGRKISTGLTANKSPYYIPVFFRVNQNGDLITGSYIEIFLKTKSYNDCLVVPKTALLEEQGRFYVYVQESAEEFHKHYVELGEDNGKNVRVLSGIPENAEIAVKGAYHIKLASMSSSLPAHSHSH